MLKLKKNKYSGKLIVFEGTDGAGKTSMIELTKQLLGREVGEDKIICVKQPTDMSRKTKLFQKMMYSKNHDDVDYRAVQLLTMSDRVQHTFEVIVPALEAGKIVICDRYIFTSLANMLARGYTNEDWFFKAARHLIRPDLSILVYASPQIAIKRIKARPEECDRYLDKELLIKVANQFIKMAKQEKLQIINSENDPACTFINLKMILMRRGFLS